MATISLPALDVLALAPFPVRRFTVEEYHRLGKLGVLTEDDRVELLDGWIVPKTNLNPSHSVSVQLVDDAVRKQLPAGWCIRIQDAITTADSEPEPDVAVVRGSIRDYTSRHPGPDDIGLVVEVADTSLARDRYKCALYGRSAIAAYWIVNLIDRRIEVYGDPTGLDANPGYRRRADYGEDDQVPLFVDGREIARLQVRDLLP
ncbi:MAG: Uma2 family endonuclease [Pirellulales bacterium]